MPLTAQRARIGSSFFPHLSDQLLIDAGMQDGTPPLVGRTSNHGWGIVATDRSQRRLTLQSWWLRPLVSHTMGSQESKAWIQPPRTSSQQRVGFQKSEQRCNALDGT